MPLHVIRIQIYATIKAWGKTEILKWPSADSALGCLAKANTNSLLGDAYLTGASEGSVGKAHSNMSSQSKITKQENKLLYISIDYKPGTLHIGSIGCRIQNDHALKILEK